MEDSFRCKMMPPPLLRFFFFLALFLFAWRAAATEGKRTTFMFLVDTSLRPSPFPSDRHWYSSLLPSTSSRLFHHYQSLLHGFSASLTPSQARAIGEHRGVVAVSPDSLLRTHTTRSPSFLCLDLRGSRLSALSHRGSAAVIGFIDTGIWPERPSFSDRGLGPPPRRWRGECEEGPGFNRSHCNRKLVGARSFSAGYAAAFDVGGQDELRSARDHDGHGTHVASIAAGASVAGAGFEGFARGLARGMAPRARIAVYKVCWAEGCMVSDVVAAIEKAVSDGVDVVSLSIGSSSPAPFYHLDPLAVATFRASLQGVFVAASAGNGGPSPGSVANSPPWITTIGAGTIDRYFPAVVRLGNGACVRGTSISMRPREPRRRHLVHLFSVGRITAADTNLTSQHINGRIVLWESGRRAARIETGAALKRAGAVGTVVYHGDVDPEGILAEPHVVPTVAVGSRGAAIIEAYIRTARNPTAVISSEGTELLPGDAPEVASFSARGPNPSVPWVLKPDILAPGVNIVGAWTDAIGPSGWAADIRRPWFSVMSGTSMACPHVSGVAALLRAARPRWGPWEIRSALMTTAAASPPVGDEAGEGGPPAAGAGHLRPERAVDPGLVYDLMYDDYVGLLCGLNYTAKSIRILTGKAAAPCEPSGDKGVWGFNYPAFVAAAEEIASTGELVFHRRLKRVDGGGPCRRYRAVVAAPAGYAAVVEPERLWFSGMDGETVAFRVVLSEARGSGGRGRRHWWKGGSLTWREEEGKHAVRSPIVVLFRRYMTKEEEVVL
ncbi:unnamed protein product [Musa banksii]